MRVETAAPAETVDGSVPCLHVVDHPASVGDRDAPVVVLVHGSLDRGTTFARVVRRLPDLHVVTYDRRGYQSSRGVRPLATSLDEHVTDLLNVVGERPSVLVGHSYGGDVALGAALAPGGTACAVGVYEPPMPWLDWWPRGVARDAGTVDPAVSAESFFRRVVSSEAWDRLPEQARDERRADGPALVADLASIRAPRPPFDLTGLTVPVVLGRGERSLARHRRVIDALQGLLPVSETVEFPGASHGAQRTHPDAFASFVRRVVERGAWPDGTGPPSSRATRGHASEVSGTGSTT